MCVSCRLFYDKTEFFERFYWPGGGAEMAHEKFTWLILGRFGVQLMLSYFPRRLELHRNAYGICCFIGPLQFVWKRGR